MSPERRIDYEAEYKRLRLAERADVDLICRQIRLGCIGLLKKPEAHLWVDSVRRLTTPFFLPESFKKFFAEMPYDWEPKGMPENLQISYDEYTKRRRFNARGILIESPGTLSPEEAKAIDIGIPYPYKESQRGWAYLRIYREPGYNFWYDLKWHEARMKHVEKVKEVLEKGL